MRKAAPMCSKSNTEDFQNQSNLKKISTTNLEAVQGTPEAISGSNLLPNLDYMFDVLDSTLYWDVEPHVLTLAHRDAR